MPPIGFAFIRVGEQLLQRFGPRKPMIRGSLIVGVAILLLMPAHLMLETYTIFAVAGFSLFGLGLAFYATPSTDAALSALLDDQAGSGSGIYKMASSLCASFGVAISAAVFTALSADASTVCGSAGGEHSRRFLRGQDLLPFTDPSLSFHVVQTVPGRARWAREEGNPV